METVSLLNQDQLLQIGIDLLGHRVEMFNYIEQLNSNTDRILR